MRTIVRAFAIVALVIGLGGIGYAAQTSKTKAKPTGTTASVPKAMSATGKIVAYDDASKTLTISTAKGEEKFVLGSSARVQEGAKTITTTNLSGLAGRQAKVRYTASGADKTAESVMVSGGGKSAKK